MLTANETNNNQYYFISFMGNLMKYINDNKSSYIALKVNKEYVRRRRRPTSVLIYNVTFMSHLIEYSVTKIAGVIQGIDE